MPMLESDRHRVLPRSNLDAQLMANLNLNSLSDAASTHVTAFESLKCSKADIAWAGAECFSFPTRTAYYVVQ